MDSKQKDIIRSLGILEQDSVLYGEYGNQQLVLPSTINGCMILLSIIEQSLQYERIPHHIPILPLIIRTIKICVQESYFFSHESQIDTSEILTRVICINEQLSCIIKKSYLNSFHTIQLNR